MQYAYNYNIIYANGICKGDPTPTPHLETSLAARRGGDLHMAAKSGLNVSTKSDITPPSLLWGTAGAVVGRVGGSGVIALFITIPYVCLRK
jgi:hypothetical protein